MPVYKNPPPRVLKPRVELPTLDEAVTAAQGLSDSPEEQAEIAANLMGVPVADVVPLVRKAANRTLVTTPNRAVVVVRRPVRTFSPRLAEAMRR
ncbi:hypothetical protein [Bosea sp. (in: a-proteobacteria)]|jgi:hypothetical protein|uniref:hypothetical protein n=1 Tax=Bosea sp. (in: a-proteobacteria) TaxID=1871050 RepID=UPI002FC9BB0A